MNNKEASHGAGVSKQVDELATISVEALFRRLGTSEAGLSDEEAERRLEQFGPNEVAAEREHTWVHRLLTASRNPLVILLTVLATISYATGDFRAGTVMLLMVILGLSLRFVQESHGGRGGGQTQGHDQRHGHGGARRTGKGNTAQPARARRRRETCPRAT